MQTPYLLRQFEQQQQFSDHEAWNLFRLAAIGEAIGWTLLLVGIGCKYELLHGNNTPVLIAGQIHGMLFLLYLVASIVVYPSLGWKRLIALVAIIASVPPYGSLVFEQIMSHYRSYSHAKQRLAVHAYHTLLA